MNATQEQFSWAKDYVDLQHQFLNDEEYGYIHRKYRNIPKNAKVGCPTCRGNRSYQWQGRKVSCDCEEQLSLHLHYLAANIPVLYQRLTWEDWEGDPSARDLLVLYLQDHEYNIAAGLGLVLHGGWGTGKTLLMALLLKELVKLGYRANFVTFTEMMDMYTRGWGSTTEDKEERERFERKVTRADVLVLDDIGKEFRTKTNLAESTFDHVMRQRAYNQFPSFLTTNIGEKELRRGYGGAVFSLLLERSEIYQMEGTDWRETAHSRMLQQTLAKERRPIV